MPGSQREERFRTLYDLSRPLVISYALRRARSPEDAADVVAETFTIAWRRLDAVPEGDGAVPWLLVTARHVLANLGRRTERGHGLIDRLGHEFRAAVSASVGPQDEGALIAKRALGRLSDRDREVILLVAWEGFSDKELSALLGCTPAAARIRLHRARSRLVDALTDEESTEKQTSAGRYGHPVDSVDSEPHIEEEQPS
jgi:RNA polymerase sigma-70 factor (ECF subfamily)